MTYNKLIRSYRQKFIEHNVDINVLKYYFFERLNEMGKDLYLEMDNEIDPSINKQLENDLELMLKHKPLAQILGYCFFYGNKIMINEDVLIPRYETEELVLNILMEIDNNFKHPNLKIVDIGTGSGAIAISLKKELPDSKVWASDISTKALDVAARNAEINNTKINFLKGDMLKPFIDEKMKFDILVSNPPYIPNDEQIDSAVKDYEPHISLFGGEDGLKYYRIILENCAKILNDQALIAFEIGHRQKEDLSLLINQYLPFATYEFIKDINAKDRILLIRINKGVK